MNKSILVTGKNGQLGRSLQKILIEISQNLNLSLNNFVFASRDEIDLSKQYKINDSDRIRYCKIGY